MILEHFLLSINETNCYIVACTETGEAAVIDPGEWNDQLAGFLHEQKLSLRWVLITHGHADHTGGLEALKRDYPEPHIAGHKRFGGMTSFFPEATACKSAS
jgi:glyoxylase-like metal-dependent hydrolase (beta-lactamase superfamily II)